MPLAEKRSPNQGWKLEVAVVVIVSIALLVEVVEAILVENLGAAVRADAFAAQKLAAVGAKIFERVVFAGLIGHKRSFLRMRKGFVSCSIDDRKKEGEGQNNFCHFWFRLLREMSFLKMGSRSGINEKNK